MVPSKYLEKVTANIEVTKFGKIDYKNKQLVSVKPTPASDAVTMKDVKEKILR